MNELTRPTESETAAAPWTAQAYCGYCGAALDQHFYFCLSCATPFKAVETVVTPHMPRRLTDGERIERTVPQVKTVFWTYFTVVVGAAVLGLPLYFIERMDLVITLQTLAMFITTCVLAVRYWPSLSVQLRRPGFLSLAAWIGLVALGPMLAINYGYHHLIERALPEQESMFEELHGQLGLGFMIAFFCVMPAIVEEIGFRGLLQHWLHIAVRPLVAIVLASALFTVMHFSVISAPYLFAVGVLLGWTRWKTGSLYPSMLIHFLHNFVVVVWF